MQGDEELRESNGKVSAREPVLLTAPSMKATPAGPMSPDSVADSCSDPQQMHSLTKHRPPTVDGSVSDVFSNRRKKERAICDVCISFATVWC